MSFREFRSTAKLYIQMIIWHADKINFLKKFVYFCLETFPWKHWLPIDFIIICFELISRLIEIIDNATFSAYWHEIMSVKHNGKFKLYSDY